MLCKHLHLHPEVYSIQFVIQNKTVICERATPSFFCVKNCYPCHCKRLSPPKKELSIRAVLSMASYVKSTFANISVRFLHEVYFIIFRKIKLFLRILSSFFAQDKSLCLFKKNSIVAHLLIVNIIFCCVSCSFIKK